MYIYIYVYMCIYIRVLDCHKMGLPLSWDNLKLPPYYVYIGPYIHIYMYIHTHTLRTTTIEDCPLIGIISTKMVWRQST